MSDRLNFVRVDAPDFVKVEFDDDGYCRADYVHRPYAVYPPNTPDDKYPIIDYESWKAKFVADDIARARREERRATLIDLRGAMQFHHDAAIRAHAKTRDDISAAHVDRVYATAQSKVWQMVYGQIGRMIAALDSEDTHADDE